MWTGNHSVNRSTRASVLEIENLSRVPGYAFRYPTEMETTLTRQTFTFMVALLSVLRGF